MENTRFWIAGGLACIWSFNVAHSSEVQKSRSPSVAKIPVAGQVNAKDSGVVGNGSFDNTAALQAALDAAEKKGPVCYLPSGHYRLNGAVVVPPGVTSCGSSGGVPHSEHPIGTCAFGIGRQRQG